jgi:hypothetical protein
MLCLSTGIAGVRLMRVLVHGFETGTVSVYFQRQEYWMGLIISLLYIRKCCCICRFRVVLVVVLCRCRVEGAVKRDHCAEDGDIEHDILVGWCGY